MFGVGDKIDPLYLFPIVKLNRETKGKAELNLALPGIDIGHSPAYGKRNDQCSNEISIIDKKEALVNERE